MGKESAWVVDRCWGKEAEEEVLQLARPRMHMEDACRHRVSSGIGTGGRAGRAACTGMAALALTGC